MYYSQQGIAKSGAEQLRLDICAKNPRLRQYPKRWLQALTNEPLKTNYTKYNIKIYGQN